MSEIEGCRLIPISEAHREADAVSCDASFNLFNWYRNNEGGLWLAEGFEDVDAVRRNHSHPWIKNDSDEDDDDLERRDSENTVNQDYIKRWQDGIVQ